MSAGIAIGPFLLSMDAATILLALAVAAAAGAVAAGGRRVGLIPALVDMAFGGLVLARVAFVTQWFEHYRLAPWTGLDIRDGGFSTWAGIGGALLIASWKARRCRPLRMPLLVALASGALAWAIVAALPRPGGAGAVSLPTARIRSLDGGVTSVAEIGKGRPTVVNLWATWCPPCRREMPVLAAAQQREGDVRFVFADQGEEAAAVRKFFAPAARTPSNVLLDADGRLANALRAPGLPTTFFFDASGKLVDSHIGQLSEASLAAKLARFSRTPDHPSSDKESDAP